MADEDDYERTLLQLAEVHVFRIPVRKTAEGHRASDFPKDPAWTGKLKIVTKRNIAAIVLYDGTTNATFAVCQVNDESAVERTLDSGRYFVLRITNAQGRNAFIGIAFNERNDAFDFNVTLSEHKNELEREKEAQKMSDEPTGPGQDFTLKEGAKIKIAFNRKKPSDGDVPPAPKSAGAATGGLLPPPKGCLLPPPKGGLLPPPPKRGASGAIAPPATPAPAPVRLSVPVLAAHVPAPAPAPPVQRTSDPFGDPFGDFSDFSNPTPNGAPGHPSTTAPPPLLQSDPFDFSGFGSDFTTTATAGPSTSTSTSAAAPPNILDFDF